MRIHTRAPALLTWGVALAASAVLTACGSGSGGSSGATAAAAQHNAADEASVTAIVQCYRAHGTTACQRLMPSGGLNAYAAP